MYACPESTPRHLQHLNFFTSNMSHYLKSLKICPAMRRQIISGGGGAPIIKNRRRRPQIDGGRGAARPAQGSNAHTGRETSAHKKTWSARKCSLQKCFLHILINVFPN